MPLSVSSQSILLTTMISEFSRFHPHRVKSADEPAHAGSRDIIHWDPMFLQPLEHSYVRETSRATAA